MAAGLTIKQLKEWLTEIWPFEEQLPIKNLVLTKVMDEMLDEERCLGEYGFTKNELGCIRAYDKELLTIGTNDYLDKECKHIALLKPTP